MPFSPSINPNQLILYSEMASTCRKRSCIPRRINGTPLDVYTTKDGIIWCRTARPHTTPVPTVPNSTAQTNAQRTYATVSTARAMAIAATNPNVPPTSTNEQRSMSNTLKTPCQLPHLRELDPCHAPPKAPHLPNPTSKKSGHQQCHHHHHHQCAQPNLDLQTNHIEPNERTKRLGMWTRTLWTNSCTQT